MAARIAGAVWPVWWAGGHLIEGRRWLEQVLQAGARGATPLPSVIRAKVLNGAGGLAFQQCDYASARAYLIECLDLRPEIGQTRIFANVLNVLGLVALEQEDTAGAQAYLEESLALFRALGDDDSGIQQLLNNLANLAFTQKDYGRATRLWDESLALSRRQGDQAAIATALTNLGWATLLQNHHEQAAAFCREALALARELGNQPILIFDLEGLAGVASAQGQATRAARLFGAAQALREAMHFPLAPSNQVYYEQMSSTARNQLGEAAYAAEWTMGGSMTSEVAAAYALDEPGAEAG
jgi:tetratricopeptide (TPR) repeat protein